MKKFMGRIRTLSEKAAEIQAAMERVPPKIAHVRETVAITGGQLRQLRADVHASVSDLRADNETTLLQALDELNRAAGTFQEAGYEFAGIDMELSPNQRCIVHLWKAAEVRLSKLESLIRANQGSRTIHGILTSISKAEEMARQVNLDGFTYQKLVVHVGPVPSVRMCWTADEEETVARIVPGIPQAIVAAPAVAKSAFEQSSFFAKRSGEPQAATISTAVPPIPQGVEPGAAPPSVSVPPPAQTPASIPQPAHGSDWKQDALEWFKKMPDLSKYRR